jgi:hypothetical protein
MSRSVSTPTNATATYHTMKTILHPPTIITPRLLAGVEINKAFLSIDIVGREHSGRVRYRYCIDLPDGQEFSGDDLRSGCQGGTLT